MASDGAPSLSGPDRTMKTGSTMSSFTALSFPPAAPGPPDPPPWEAPPQTSVPVPSAFPSGSPLVLSAFPSSLLMTGDGGPSGTGAAKVIFKLKADTGPAEPPQTQNFILSQTALNWMASSAPRGDPEGGGPQLVAASNVTSILPAKAVGVSQERSPGLPPQALPSVAQLTPLTPPEKAWPATHGTPGEGGPLAARPKSSLGDLAHTSKGVYENFRRWQRYKGLARRHVAQSSDAEAFSCFLIPVLRSLARLKPTMTLEEGLPRAVQEWERTSNFDRMIFYEMAEKFMEFEAEEEMQIQNAQLLNGSQCLPPAAAPLHPDPPVPLAPPASDVGQQSVYIPKKAAAKTRAPRRRQRKSQKAQVPEAPKEIPAEAVKEYTSIMEGLMGSHPALGELDGKREEEEQQQEEGMYPDPGLLSYIEELCCEEVFVTKVEAIIHPQFLADLLSPDLQRDPLALTEELQREEELTLGQLVQKRLMALEEEEAEALAPASCTGAQLDSSPSVSDEDEGGSGHLRPSPGPRMLGRSVCPRKAASSGKRARLGHGGRKQALKSSRGMRRDGSIPTSTGSGDLKLELTAPQGLGVPSGTESRGCGNVTNQTAPPQDGQLEGAGPSGHSLVVDRISEGLPIGWQEDPQLEGTGAPCLDIGLAEPAPLQSPGLEQQVLGLQTEQMGTCGVLPQEKEHLALTPGDSAGGMWGDDCGPPILQSDDQDPSPGAAGDRDGAPLSPGLWLGSEMNIVGLELPFQLEEVIEDLEDGDSVAEPQGGCEAQSSGSNVSLCLGESLSLGDTGTCALPCGDSETTATSEKRKSRSLRGPQRASSPELPKENNPEITRDPSDPWAEGFSPLLESGMDAPTLGSSKETLLAACQGNNPFLRAQDASSFPKVSKESGSRGNSFSPLLEATSRVDGGGDRGLRLTEVSERPYPLNLNSYVSQGQGKEDTNLYKPKDLAPSRGPSKSKSHQGRGRAHPVRETKDASRLRQSSAVATGHSAKKEEEDEELSNFAYLLASKLSLSPTGIPLCPCPVAKSVKRALVGGPAPTRKKPHQGAGPEEKPLAPGVDSPSQPRKRRQESFVTGKRKKRRRCQ
ncbi:NUT family member 1 [Echinops telfairi]|uniref:NUT family member 1 n=1 Tax=Echinops telfairi TaxID=9371 RepID=A0ABM0J1K1_ECHTE|nr:NUT family member 1 [Echinops telfairi]